MLALVWAAQVKVKVGSSQVSDRQGCSPHFLLELSKMKMMLQAVQTLLEHSVQWGSMLRHGDCVCDGFGACMHAQCTPLHAHACMSGIAKDYTPLPGH